MKGSARTAVETLENVRRVKAPAGLEPAQIEDVDDGASAVTGPRRGQGSRVGCGGGRPTSLQADAATPPASGGETRTNALALEGACAAPAAQLKQAVGRP
ncbi:MAG: hypothetical protein JXA21_10320, partial [Anaerolineae bacterium]|nr:hypothetical protein [Anaerolineae bacterium]